jgi:cysteine desulfurase
MGMAAALAWQGVPDYEKNVRPLRDALETGILASVPNSELNGHKTLRLGNTSNITFRGVKPEALLLLLDEEGICASSGSACLADSDEPSHVLHAMKPEADPFREAIRFSCGSSNMRSEIGCVISAVREGVQVLREMGRPSEDGSTQVTITRDSGAP